MTEQSLNQETTMPTVELPEEVWQRAQRSAEASHATLEHWIAEAIERQSQVQSASDPVLGLFSDIPDVMDKVVEDAMTTREQSPLRIAHG
jgi:hypothetical protein